MFVSKNIIYVIDKTKKKAEPAILKTLKPCSSYSRPSRAGTDIINRLWLFSFKRPDEIQHSVDMKQGMNDDIRYYTKDDIANKNRANFQLGAITHLP